MHPDFSKPKRTQTIQHLATNYDVPLRCSRPKCKQRVTRRKIAAATTTTSSSRSFPCSQTHNTHEHTHTQLWCADASHLGGRRVRNIVYIDFPVRDLAQCRIGFSCRHLAHRFEFRARVHIRTIKWVRVLMTTCRTATANKSANNRKIYHRYIVRDINTLQYQ